MKLSEKKCIVDVCEKPMFASNGFCRNHDYSFKKYGDPLKASKRMHGFFHREWYFSFKNMNGRCHNPKHGSYRNYGLKGIGVCMEWRTPEGFAKWADGAWSEARKRYPNQKLSIDRKNKYMGYCPENCRVIPMSENSKRANSKSVERRLEDGSWERFESADEAERQTGIDSGNIGKVCLRKKHYYTAGDYKWRFAKQ